MEEHEFLVESQKYLKLQEFLASKKSEHKPSKTNPYFLPREFLLRQTSFGVASRASQSFIRVEIFGSLFSFKMRLKRITGKKYNTSASIFYINKPEPFAQAFLIL
jgi:hypothetical protein